MAPYSTTPNRGNINHPNSWNQHLARETAALLVEALRELRGLGWLNASALQTLPLKMEPDFDEGGRFAQMFQAVKDALLDEKLLPAYGGGHIAAQNAKLAGSRELRELVSPEQLAQLFASTDALFWLSDDITTDRANDLYVYLTKQLKVAEVTTEWLIPRLTREFLEAQSDAWIARLYEFLNRQRSLLNRLRSRPLVRLEDGSHTRAIVDGKPQAYLPGKNPTGFPTVRRSVCRTEEARGFLRSIRLRDPDLADDVIENLLPKYRAGVVNIPDQEYESDISRILTAFGTDSTERRTNLVSNLRGARFVAAVDMGDKVCHLVMPRQAYLATERLKGLFKDVPGVLIVDDSREYLRGEQARSLLRNVGVSEYLSAIPVDTSLTPQEKRELRLNSQWKDPNFTRDVEVEDFTLMGLDSLLTVLTGLSVEQGTARAGLLWTALGDFQTRHGVSAFNAWYRWYRYGDRHTAFPANFLKTLQAVAWVPDKDGALRLPGSVVFQDTGWIPNLVLAEKIQFKSAVIEELAKKAGIEPGALDFMRNHGITEADLRKKFGIKDDNGPSPNGTTGKRRKRTTDGGRTNRYGPGGNFEREPKPSISITLRTSSDGNNGDGPGDGNPRNKEVEDAAIEFILKDESSLKRTKDGNHGFDLWETGLNDQPKRWIEVKSSAGVPDSVALSITQFRFALEKQNAYWLYVVVNATREGDANIFKIKNPAQRILDTIDGFNLSTAWIEKHRIRGNTEEG